ncbi:MAG TPA: polysaccharide biosynthesis tyrosine autokinase [Pseudomonadales bacterium]|nr:polysaccharide biosynthesis tyrosine autokinase [Pseudomonadales bacterium]
MSNSDNNPESRLSGGEWTPSQRPASAAEEEGVSIAELLNVVRSGKWMIAAVAGVVLILAALYAFLAPSVYQANALVQIQEQNQSAGASSDILSALLPIAAPADTEIAIMTSRAVLQPTVESEHLNILVDSGGLPIIGRFFGNSSAQSVAINKLKVPDDWMDEDLTLTSEGEGAYVLESPDGDPVLHGRVGQLESAHHGEISIMVNKLALPKGDDVTVKRIYDQEAIAALQAKLTASEQGQDTGIVQLTLDGVQPAEVKSILNTLVDKYIQQNVAAMASQAQNSLVFIKKQLPKLKQQLETAQDKLTEYRQKNGAVDLDKQAAAMLDELTTLESQLTQINLAETALRQRYTGRYPSLRSLKQQAQDIQGKIDAIHAQINQLPGQEQKYLTLMRDVKVYEQLYTALLAKSQDLQIAKASTTGSARVVDYAVKPITPVAPRKAVVIVLGLILGLFLGILIVFLRRSLSRAIQSVMELENAFGLPVFAIVPHSDRQTYLINKAKRGKAEKVPPLAFDDPRDPTIESIRSLRTSINFTINEFSKKIITLGGCSPSVGKSFLSINLAHVMGNAGTKVLIIDADMRLGHLEEYVGGRKEPGLSQVLSGQATLEDAIYTSPYGENIDFLPSGSFPPNPYELFAGPEMEPMLNSCAEKYDVVIIDVPPVLSVAEGLIIGRLATLNFLVIKAGEQTVQEVRLALDRSRQNGVKLAGFVFNDLTRQSASYTYGRYAVDHYYSRYGGKYKK